MVRNRLGTDRLFVSSHHPLHALFKGLYEAGAPADYSTAADIDPKLTHGVAGKIWADDQCNPSEK